MSAKLGKTAQRVLELLLEIPPRLEEAEKRLRSGALAPGQMTRVALEYSDMCFCEAGDFMEGQAVRYPMAVIPGLHSTYIRDVVKKVDTLHRQFYR